MYAHSDPEPSPLVSCIMPTYNRRAFVPQSLSCFFSQQYPNLELVVVDDGSDPISGLLPNNPRIRYFRVSGKLTIGAKRNYACERARGDYIAHWDDDDWYCPSRIRRQLTPLLNGRAQISGTSTEYYYNHERNEAFLYEYRGSGCMWMGSLMYPKSLWAQRPFEPIHISEDVRFIAGVPPAARFDLKDPALCVAALHASNASPKNTTGLFWSPVCSEKILAIIGNLQAQPENVSRTAVSSPRPSALVAAARGIGDILRITSLVRVFHGLGYAVDLLLEPDYAETVTLLAGAPEIRHLFWRTTCRTGQVSQHLEGLQELTYDVAVFTAWASELQKLVHSRSVLSFDRNEWLLKGDSFSVEKIARAVHWSGPIPVPFAQHSDRRFGLPPDTVVLHPGCKPDWPWKKWHGFDELARLLPEVAVIGTTADLRNEKTYFSRPFQWPTHARMFVGQLSLLDTAALIAQSRAMVSNDSGMLHLAVALGVPAFGVFGITSPAREGIPAPNMFPITKGLSCEPSCRRQPWGRRDCDRHLECLRILTPDEVLAGIAKGINMQQTPPANGAPPRPFQCSPELARTNSSEDIGLAYHGNVFDTSGYGNAARAYIHALHSAGIRLSVIDLASHGSQVRDTLVESLLNRKVSPDFHLFHGIPTYWARQAFCIPNAIGMTVWEADTMPSQWRNILSHVVDLWLPCDFNVAAFSRELPTSIFRLPHPVPRRHLDDGLPDAASLSIAESDFVFYCIFEWQERKSPVETLTAFLQAFREESDVMLVLKTNPAAADQAKAALAQARAQTGSRARVSLHAAAWSEPQIEALHARGNCYISLHRGEGWCYPLFEAACRGTPVIATAYSGPLDYLSPEAHHLVPYQATPVRQPYLYYTPRMHWADPQIEHAVIAMRRVYEQRDDCRRRAVEASIGMREIFAPEAIGALARTRLMELKQARPRRLQRTNKSLPSEQKRPSIPIPGDWYDQDYFERGLKSNWEHGYSWRSFEGLFRDTARFLVEAFPDAQSFLDAGCAKGFLVRCLREAGKECWGFDHSGWAIRNAETAASPFIKLASADEFPLDRSYDVLLALDLLAHLTEQQARSLLIKTRSRINVCVLASIPSREPGIVVNGDRDLSHITMQPRAWWRQLFLECGWRQDALHAVAERILQNQELPHNMKWELYVYSPGS